MRARMTSAAALFGALLAMAAQAQPASIIEIDPFGVTTGQSSARPAAPPRDAPLAPSPAPVPRLALEAATGERVLRLVGEQAGATLSLVAPAGARPVTLEIAHRSSVNVLPARSSLRVIVNGIAGDPVPLDAFDDFTTLSLPADGLRPGLNEVRLEAMQSHRIYCGPEASFALWTEIDLTLSGATLPPDGEPGGQAADIGFVRAAMARQSAAGEPVELRVGPGVDDASARATMSALAAHLPRGALAPRLTSVWAPAPSRQPFARVTLLAGAGDALSVMRGGDGALVLRVVAGAEPAALARRMAAALPVAAVAAAPVAVTPGAPTPLSALGLSDAGDHGSYVRRDLAFMLPHDWLLLASQKARLNLRYSFAPNLPERSVLMVRVNGTTVRLLPLDRGEGAEDAPLDVRFEARLLRPGANALSFEAVVPGDPPDMACPIRTTPTLSIDPASSLDIPPSPRMRAPGMGPGLAALAGGGVRGSGDAATAVAAHLRTVQGAGSQLTVIGAGGVETARLGHPDLTRRRVETLFSRPVAPTAGPATAAAPSLLDAAADRVAALAGRMARFARAGDPSLAQWLEGRRARALLVLPDDAEPGALLLVLGPDADPHQVGRAIDQGRLSPDGPRGHVALLTADGAWESWTAPDAALTLLEPLSWSNVRVVLGNYASWSPAVFTASGLGLAWLSAALAMIFVVSTREAGKK